MKQMLQWISVISICSVLQIDSWSTPISITLPSPQNHVTVSFAEEEIHVTVSPLWTLQSEFSLLPEIFCMKLASCMIFGYVSQVSHLLVFLQVWGINVLVSYWHSSLLVSAILKTLMETVTYVTVLSGGAVTMDSSDLRFQRLRACTNFVFVLKKRIEKFWTISWR